MMSKNSIVVAVGAVTLFLCGLPITAEGAGLVSIGHATPAAAKAGDLVKLDASPSQAASSVPIVFYQWEQISGPSVVITNCASKEAFFFVPSAAHGTRLLFKLTVHGGDNSVSSLVHFMVVSPGGDD